MSSTKIYPSSASSKKKSRQAALLKESLDYREYIIKQRASKYNGENILLYTDRFSVIFHGSGFLYLFV